MTIRQDMSSKFQRFIIEGDDEKYALQVSPMFLAYLKNKQAVYAEALVENVLPYDPDPGKQVAAIVEHERLRNFCFAYEELINEIIAADSSHQPQPQE